MLQKQREDLDRVTEENKILKSRYENAIEVNVHFVEMLISNLIDVYIYAYVIINLVQAVLPN